MKLPEDGILLRIFIGESDRNGWKSLYEQIVYKAKELDLAGATVVRGIMGFGANSRIHTAKLLRVSEDMPLIIEIVDSEEYIQRILWMRCFRMAWLLWKRCVSSVMHTKKNNLLMTRMLIRRIILIEI